jgi:hypothetical protein
MPTAIVPTIRNAYEKGHHANSLVGANRWSPLYTRPIRTVITPQIKNAARLAISMSGTIHAFRGNVNCRNQAWLLKKSGVTAGLSPYCLLGDSLF